MLEMGMESVWSLFDGCCACDRLCVECLGTGGRGRKVGTEEWCRAVLSHGMAAGKMRCCVSRGYCCLEMSVCMQQDIVENAAQGTERGRGVIRREGRGRKEGSRKGGAVYVCSCMHATVCMHAVGEPWKGPFGKRYDVWTARPW
jgi:hypothetical protein